MLEKYRIPIIGAILILGFALRLSTAALVPPTYDEMDDLPSAQEISFDGNQLNLPLVDTRRESAPIAFKYIAKIGWFFLGDSLLAARFPFVIMATLIILLVYCMTRFALGTHVALLASLLLAISQYDIAISRVANINPPQVFFFACSLYLFYKAITVPNKKLLLCNGLVIGIGFWVKESVAFVIPIYLIFLGVCAQFRYWLKEKTLWISFIIAFCVMLPLIILNFNPEVPRYSHVHSEAAIGFSLNAIGSYLGELMLILSKPFPEVYENMVLSLDMEYPIINFVVGLVILAAVVMSLKNKNPFIRLMVVAFLFNFIMFSFLRRRDVINSFVSIGSLDWSILGFVPGVILAANMLVDLLKTHRLFGRTILGILFVVMLFRAGSLVTYPLPGYFPIKDYFLERQLEWANVLFAGEHEQDIYLPPGGNIQLAKETFEKVYSLSDHHAGYKKDAALKLAKIHFQQDNQKECRVYLDYVLSQEPDNYFALKLLKAQSL